MPSFSVFKIFQIFGIVSAWATKAFADGKVTLAEAVELAIALCAILGIKTELELPDQNSASEILVEHSLDPDKIPGTIQDLDGSQRASPKLKPV